MADPRFSSSITIFTDIGGIQVNITRKIEEIYTTELSPYVIEDGSEITDNAVIKPVKLLISGGFSDVVITKLVGGTFNSFRGKWKTQVDRVLSLMAGKEPFDLMNGVHLFQNVQATQFRMVKDKPNFSSSFEAELQTVQIVESGQEVISLPDITDTLSRAKLLASTVAQSGVASTGELNSAFGIVA